MDSTDLSLLIKGSNEIFLARGGDKNPLDEEEATIAFAFSSVVSIKEIKKGELITEENIWVKRPGGGYYKSNDYYNLIGKTAKINIPNDSQISKKDIL